MANVASVPPGNPFRFLLSVPVPWVFILAYLAGAGIELLLFRGSAWSHSQAMPIAGVVLFILGAVIAGWGWLIFQRQGTTRVPGEISTAMVTSGPYKVTRNPMYVGLTLAYIGEAGIQKQLAPLALLLLVLVYLNWIVIPLEESRLRQAFGAAYQKYCSKVRRWL